MGHVSIRLDRFTVVNKRDELGKDDPYLWVIGLQIVPTRSNVAGLEFVQSRSPLPGNLGGGFKRGESRAVPAAIGHIEYEVTPLFGALMFGVVVIAWEHDRTPAPTIQAAYNQTAAAIDQFIRDIIDSRLQEGLDDKGQFRPVSDAERDALRTEIKGRLKALFLASAGVVPWTLNIDDFVGAGEAIEKVKDNAAVTRSLSMTLRKRENVGAHYELTGTLTYTP
jgi:hypothetical protein